MCAGLRYVRYVRTVQYQLLTPFLVEDLSVGMQVSAIFVKPSTQQCRVRCAVCGVRRLESFAGAGMGGNDNRVSVLLN